MKDTECEFTFWPLLVSKNKEHITLISYDKYPII